MKGANATRGLILAVSCLVLGFVGGWSIANIGGKTIALPEAKVDVTVAPAAPKTGEQPVTGETTAAPPTPARADLVVVVLNASGVNGRAAATATQLQGLGYAKVTTGTIAQVTGTSVLYAEGAKAGGDQLAADLQLQTVAPLAGNPAETAAAAAQLVVVLGK